MRPLAVVGNVNVDMILGPTAPWPTPGSEVFVDHSELRVGGSASNSALTWQALGADFQFVANSGSDLYGAWMRDQLTPHSAAWPVADGPSTISVGITHPDGERTFFTNKGHLAVLDWPDVRDGFDWDGLSGGYLLLCGAFLLTALAPDFPALFAKAHDHDIRVALDTGWPPDGWDEATRQAAMEWAGGSDCLLVNEVEAAALSGVEDPKLAGRALLDLMRPGSIVVVKIGPQGAWAFHDDEAVHAPAPLVRVVDTIGAGDVFNAAFLMGLADGSPLGEATELGVRAASRAISTFPRRYGPDPA
ncbi:MAG: carbohydrate kinase family protein [Rhodobiaceae bacterium]|nr:carbohydrate kinase family protein [Rhodobiaceae bacterium]